MFKRVLILWLVVAMLLPVLPSRAQDDDCGSAPPSQLIGEHHAIVIAGQTVPVYETLNGPKVGDITPRVGAIYLIEGPQCNNHAWWWRVAAGEFYYHWIPESVNGQAVLEPYRFTPPPPVSQRRRACRYPKPTGRLHLSTPPSTAAIYSSGERPHSHTGKTRSFG